MLSTGSTFTDERSALPHFKIRVEHTWKTDPHDDRALLLDNADVPRANLDCLTTEDWVPMGAVSRLSSL